MADGKFIAYYRVSTDRQGASGLGLEAQKKAVADFLNGGDWELLGEYTEVESGKRHENRPELHAALSACKRNKATLVIAKLDRLSRNVAFIATVLDSKVEVAVVDMPHADTLTLHIMAAVAQHERKMVSERTKAALAAKKARGAKLGNRVNLAEAQAKGSMATKRAAEAFAANVLPIIEQIQKSGIASYNGIAAALNARGIQTARGGLWAAATVRNVLLRAPAPELAHAA